MSDLPPAVVYGEIPQSCVMLVARSYQLEPELLGGILYVEGGRRGMANKNSNGSYDYGPAQINSAWLSKTKEAGVTANDLQHDSCKNLWAAGWIMRRCLNKFNNSFWHGVGCYHTGENPKLPEQLARQRSYAVKVHNAIQKTRGAFLRWLNS
ncbi:lytic transglycosylase domain-containing protein [Pseudomonas sp.]|uniref:lytic transglycosylase domain-containing protein n=1 Tax=Pseudomonas sp. TaxID=306 RepID=UPI0029153680|nr:lytic transglycosylase domain-containing protein [Pseudomonas sp.]MDU4254433.1 lytic transglycosylase domain-containing protein [Pseudomonas sp.]